MRIRCWRSLTLRRSSSSSVYPDVDFFLLEDPGGDPFIGLLLLFTTGDMGEGKQNESVSTLGSAPMAGSTSSLMYVNHNNNNPFQSLPAPAPSKNPFKSSNL